MEHNTIMRSTLSHFRIAVTIIAIILILTISGACTSPIIQSQSNLPSEQNAQINNKNGIISDKSYEYLIAEIDAGLIESQANWPAFYGQAVNRYNAINRLSIAVVHEQDMENAISALTKIGFVVTCLPSIGGFLRRRNISLLIGYEKGQEEAVFVALNKSCRKRIDYLVNPTTLTDHVPLIPTPITVVGATIFSFKVERFEIF